MYYLCGSIACSHAFTKMKKSTIKNKLILPNLMHHEVFSVIVFSMC